MDENAAPTPDSGLDSLVADTVNGLQDYLSKDNPAGTVRQEPAPSVEPSHHIDGKSRQARLSHPQQDAGSSNDTAGEDSHKAILWETTKSEAKNAETPSSGLDDLKATDDSSANQSLESFAKNAPSTQSLAQETAKALLDEAGRSDHPLRQYIAASGLSIFSDSTRVDPDRVSDLTEQESRILRAYEAHFRALGQVLNENVKADDLIAAADSLRRDLADPEALRIPTLKLCTSVTSFGNYQEFSSTTFPAGRGVDLLAYVELDNLHSAPNRDGLQESRLSAQFDLLTGADGIIVFTVPAHDSTDTCRSVRRDFFLVEHIRLPATLGPGAYRLRTRITDKSTGVTAEATTPIDLTASGSH